MNNRNQDYKYSKMATDPSQFCLPFYSYYWAEMQKNTSITTCLVLSLLHELLVSCEEKPARFQEIINMFLKLNDFKTIFALSIFCAKEQTFHFYVTFHFKCYILGYIPTP